MGRAFAIGNIVFHQNADKSPFEIVYGKSSPTLASYVAGDSKVDVVDQELRKRQKTIISDLRVYLQGAQDRMKRNTDFLCKPYRKSPVNFRSYQKLSKHYFRPFHIEYGRLMLFTVCHYQRITLFTQYSIFRYSNRSKRRLKIALVCHYWTMPLTHTLSTFQKVSWVVVWLASKVEGRNMY